MSNNKMKGLLKGLRYISQIFDNEKEPEMQIGFPTDVKHVAHIGWDGPSVNSPSWMNEFKGPPGFQSAPLDGIAGEANDDAVKWVSEDSNRKVRGHKSTDRDSPGLPKSSRQHSSSDGGPLSPTKEKSDKPKQSRRSSKHSNRDGSEGSTKSIRKPKDSASQGSDSLPDIPKKSRRKKSKESVGGGSSRSSRRAHHSDSDQISDALSESGSVSVPNDHYSSSAFEERGESGFS